MHLHDKQGAYILRQIIQKQPQGKCKKRCWGEKIEEPKINNEMGIFVVQLQEEMWMIVDVIGQRKQEGWELKKRVMMAEEAARKAEIEKEKERYERLDLQIGFQTLVTTMAEMAKPIDNDPDYAEFGGYVDPPKKIEKEGVKKA